ncbi:MAG: hypothetical protein RL248_1489, partial [Pseudomonadota bacterium]
NVKHIANTAKYIIVGHITALFLLVRVDACEYRKKKGFFKRQAGRIVQIYINFLNINMIND